MLINTSVDLANVGQKGFSFTTTGGGYIVTIFKNSAINGYIISFSTTSELESTNDLLNLLIIQNFDNTFEETINSSLILQGVPLSLEVGPDEIIINEVT